MIKKELWYCRSRFHSSFFGGNQMKIKRLKRPFVLILAFVLLLSSISQSVSAADTGQVINYPSLPIFKGKSFNAFGKTHHSMNYYQVGLVDGAVPAFCIEEGKKLPDNTVMTYENMKLNRARPYLL